MIYLILWSFVKYLIHLKIHLISNNSHKVMIISSACADKSSSHDFIWRLTAVTVVTVTFRTVSQHVRLSRCQLWDAIYHEKATYVEYFSQLNRVMWIFDKVWNFSVIKNLSSYLSIIENGLLYVPKVLFNKDMWLILSLVKK